jgi:hypothetical protein
MGCTDLGQTDVELSFAINTGEERNEQRHLTRNNLAREHTIVNLVNSLSPYVISERKNFTKYGISNNETTSAPETIDTINGNHDISFDLISALDFIENKETGDLNDEQLDDNFNLMNELRLSNAKQASLLLHPYTNISTKEFCTNLLHFFRQTNLCKTYSFI